MRLQFPQNATNNQKIRIILTGDGGLDQKDYNVVDSVPVVTTVDTDLSRGWVGEPYADDIEAAGGDALLS